LVDIILVDRHFGNYQKIKSFSDSDTFLADRNLANLKIFNFDILNGVPFDWVETHFSQKRLGRQTFGQ